MGAFDGLEFVWVFKFQRSDIILLLRLYVSEKNEEYMAGGD